MNHGRSRGRIDGWWNGSPIHRVVIQRESSSVSLLTLSQKHKTSGVRAPLRNCSSLTIPSSLSKPAPWIAGGSNEFDHGYKDRLPTHYNVPAGYPLSAIDDCPWLRARDGCSPLAMFSGWIPEPLGSISTRTTNELVIHHDTAMYFVLCYKGFFCVSQSGCGQEGELRPVTEILARVSSPLKHWFGLDRAIAFTVASRICNIIGSVGTVLLIVHFLTPVEQGYYYTLLSLAMLQTIFHFGFSFVVQLVAAHESALCTVFSNGEMNGDPVAFSRLASILQLTVRWYFRAAVAMIVIILPLGLAFFIRGARLGNHVAWLFPWLAVVFLSSANFFVTPLFAFLEGCNQIREVAKLRFEQAGVVIVMSWGALLAHHGLYAPAMVNLGVVLTGIVFLWRRRRLLRRLMQHDPGQYAISWRSEVWTFQWKIAVSWLCAYLTSNIFTPVLFYFCGPVDAGRLGISLSIVAYLPLVVLSWITTKATPFGQLIKLGRLQEFDALFFRALKHSLTLLLIMVAGCMAGIIGLWHWFPHFAVRMATPAIFAALLLTAISSFLVQSMGTYLRSFKEEPFLGQSIAVALLTVATALVAAPLWGVPGVVLSYMLCVGIIGLISGIVIFRSKRLKYMNRLRNL